MASTPVSVSGAAALPLPPARTADSNKGTYGRVLIVAGSRGMSGAAALAGLGALRGGAGLVELATPIGVQAIVAAIETSWLTTGLPEDSEGRLSAEASKTLANRFESASAVAIGSGWGLSEGTRTLAAKLVAECPCPMVVDADALNALADLPDVWRKAVAPRIITPHPGEFARLLKTTVSDVQTDRSGKAKAFAETHSLVVVLKGTGSVITDGTRLVVNSTGNPGMATGGTGDVLTGLIAALLAQ